MDRDKLQAELLRDEGLRLKPYRDSVGKLTIGVGRNLDDRGISQDEAIFMLDNDIVIVESEIDRVLPWVRAIHEDRQRVIANMMFNLGADRLLGFKNTLAALHAGDYETTARGMLDSKWAKQVGVRATRLAEIMRNVK